MQFWLPMLVLFLHQLGPKLPRRCFTFFKEGETTPACPFLEGRYTSSYDETWNALPLA